MLMQSIQSDYFLKGRKILKQILKENKAALEKVGGLSAEYLKDSMPQALLAFYRQHFITTPEALINKVTEGVNWVDMEAEKKSEAMIEMVEKLFPGVQLEVFQGTPVGNDTYLAIVHIPAKLCDSVKVVVDEHGGIMTTTVKADEPDAPMEIVGLYTKDNGFRFPAGPITSASIDDVLDYTLIHQAKEV